MKTARIALGVAIASLAFPVLAVTTPTTYTLNGASAPSATTYAIMGGTTDPNAATNSSSGYNGGASSGGSGTTGQGSNYGNIVQYPGSGGGQSVLVSAYGSTGAFLNGGTTGYDRAIETAYSHQYGSNGLGITSQPEPNGTNTKPTLANYAGGNGPTDANNNELVTTSGGSTVTTCTSGSCYDNQTSPYFEHAIDNHGGYESLLLSFTTATKLSSFSVGFPSTAGNSPDSDATVLEYVGGSGCSATVTGKSYADLVTTGGAGNGCWIIAGNFYNLIAGTTASLSTSLAASQYWMIGAYLNIGSNATSNLALGANGITFGNDAIKVSSFSVNRVPEPSTIALFGIAGAALVARRRRARKI